MNDRSLIPLLAFLLLSSGCTPSEERVRAIVGEELRSRQTRTFITGGDVIGPYSPAVRAGDLLFVSGQIGLSPATGALAGDDIESQTRQAMENLGSVLRQAGCDSSDVVQCNVFLTNIQDFPKMNLVYGGYFPEDRYPARSTIEVRALPRQAIIEIAAIALVPPTEPKP